MIGKDRMNPWWQHNSSFKDIYFSENTHSVLSNPPTVSGSLLQSRFLPFSPCLSPFSSAYLGLFDFPSFRSSVSCTHLHWSCGCSAHFNPAAPWSSVDVNKNKVLPCFISFFTSVVLPSLHPVYVLLELLSLLPFIFASFNPFLSYLLSLTFFLFTSHLLPFLPPYFILHLFYFFTSFLPSLPFYMNEKQVVDVEHACLALNTSGIF